MKKKSLSIFIALLLTIGLLTSCGNSADATSVQEQLSQSVIENICNLSTLECYFHNVAKADKNSYVDGTFFDFLKRNRKLWIEYNGIVKVGIDGSKVKIKPTETGIEITIPEAQIISISYDDDSLNRATIYASEDDWLVPNVITADIQSDAIQFAQTQMAMDVENNKQLMKNAQIRAQVLIKSYIEKLAAASDQDIQITWKYADGSTSTEIPETDEDYSETIE